MSNTTPIAVAMSGETGPDHLNVAEELNNLAASLCRMDHLDESLAMHLEALRVKEHVLGSLHPSIATSHQNIALTLRDQKKFAEAAAHIEQAIIIRRGVSGEEHAMTMDLWQRLAGLRQMAGQVDEARRIYEKVLAVQEKNGQRAELVRTRLALAKLLFSTEKERPWAMALVAAARQEALQLGDSSKADLAAIDAWLEEIKTTNTIRKVAARVARPASR